MKNVVYLTTLYIGLLQLTFAQAPDSINYSTPSQTSSQAQRLDSLRKPVTGNASSPKTSAVTPGSASVSSSAAMPGETPTLPAVFSYGSIPIQDRNVIRSYYVDLAFNKTTCIIFKSPIRSVDLGSKDIIADKASAVDNVLRVKASTIGFNETNFSVMTADGQFYSFVVNYNEFPTMLALDLSVNDDGVVQQKARSISQKGTVVSF